MFHLTKKYWNELVTICDHISPNMKYSYILPLAFTEHGVTMLSSVLRSDIAINVNIQIVRAFVAMRQMLSNPPIDEVKQLQTEFREFKAYIEEVFTDYNDLHEDTRMQLELINESLAELQVNRKLSDKPRNPIGFRIGH